MESDKSRGPTAAVPWSGAALVLFAGVLWSLQGLLIRLIDEATPEQVIFWRNLGQASVLWTALWLRSGGHPLRAVRRAGGAAVVGGLCQVISAVTVVFAFVHTTVANVVFIMSASPFIAGLLAWMALGEQLGRRTWAAMALGLLGVGVMMLEGLTGAGGVGNIFALICTVGFAGLAVVLRSGRGIDMLPAVCWGGSFGIIAGVLLTRGQVATALSDIALAFGMGAGLVAVGLIAFAAGARYVAAGLLAFLSLTEVVLAPVWAWIGINEVPSVLTFAGGALVLGAIVFEAAASVRRGRYAVAYPRDPL